MRKSLIASSLAVLAVTGLAGGVAYATDSDAAPAAPTTLPPGMDMLAGMGLDPEQIQCLVDSFGTTDPSDMTAMMELMTQCGITMEQLMQIGQQQLATTVPGSETGDTSTTAVGATPGEIDAATAAAALALLGLDQAAVDCLVGQSAALPPGDDAAAEAAFVACEVGPAQIIAGIVALDAAAGDGTVDDGTVEATATTAAAGPVGTTGNAMLDMLLSQLAAQGINLDAEQGQCLLDNISDLDPNDIASVMSVMESCGIDLTDLAGG